MLGKIVENIVVQAEQCPAEVDGVTRDLAASKLREELELVLAGAMRRVLFRQAE